MPGRIRPGSGHQDGGSDYCKLERPEGADDPARGPGEDGDEERRKDSTGEKPI